MTNNKQLCRIIYYSLAALHVSSYIFAHHQKHLNCITASGITHVRRCRLVSWELVIFVYYIMMHGNMNINVREYFITTHVLPFAMKLTVRLIGNFSTRHEFPYLGHDP